MFRGLFRFALVAVMVLAPSVLLAACGSDDEKKAPDSTAGGTSHYSGEDCGSCHDGLASEYQFTFSGTVYTSQTSTKTVAGAKMKIFDNVENKLIELTTDLNGNFFTSQGDPSRGWTAELSEAMIMPSDNGSCNTAGCHDAKLRMF